MTYQFLLLTLLLSLSQPVPAGTECAKLLDNAYSNLKDINLYDILWTCYHGSKPRQEALAQVRAGLQARSWPLGGSVRPGAVPTWSDLLGGELGHVPPCLDSRSVNVIHLDYRFSSICD